jgi:hypothetical protein
MKVVLNKLFTTPGTGATLAKTNWLSNNQMFFNCQSGQRLTKKRLKSLTNQSSCMGKSLQLKIFSKLTLY